MAKLPKQNAASGKKPGEVIPTLAERLKQLPAPEPFDETKDKDRFWEDDPGDGFVPKGWISDNVYLCRGMEVPTLFTVWASLYALSAAIKREAWIAWQPDPMFANLFIALVGPAGIVKKNQTMKIAAKSLIGMQQYISDNNLKLMKAINVVRGKLTPESIFEAMRPENKSFSEPTKNVFDEWFYLQNPTGEFILGPNGQAIRYYTTSEIALVLDEMAVTIGRKKYSQGLIEDLLELYECYESWDWRTVSRGVIKLRNMHTSLIAGTTSNGFRDSVSETALGDGFMSRMIIVHQASTQRDFSRPTMPKNGPTMDDLKKRLAWIAETTLGEYDFDKKTEERYETWYKTEHRAELRQNPSLSGLKSRRDILVRKVAFLIRSQRYNNSDRRIHLEDFEDAQRLIQYTYNQSAGLIAQIGSDKTDPNTEKVANFIQHKGKVIRRTAQTTLKMSTDEMNHSLELLSQEGRILIERDGQRVFTVSSAGEETYIWKGPVYVEQKS